MEIDIKIVWTIISAIIVVVGCVIAVLTYVHNTNKGIEEKASSNANINAKLDYIGKNTDETRLEIKDINKNLQNLSERVSLVEHDVKSAHKRIDRLEKEQVIEKEQS